MKEKIITYLDIGILSVSSFVTSALTAVVGAGGGTALIAIMLQIMHPSIAIPIHGIQQLSSNTTRVLLFWKDMSWPIIFRFSLLMPIGVWMGLKVFQELPVEIIQILIGSFILFSLIIQQIGRNRNKDFPYWGFYPLGLITGALNMLVGVIAPILGVLVIRKELSKESIVGTLGFFGFIGNLLKIIGFTIVGFSFMKYSLAIICVIPSGIIGTYVGRVGLSKLNEKYFLILFRIVLIILAIKLITIDGLKLHKLI